MITTAWKQVSSRIFLEEANPLGFPCRSHQPNRVPTGNKSPTRDNLAHEEPRKLELPTDFE
jgi:hypothetical protein